MSGLKFIAEIKSSKNIIKFEVLVINMRLLVTLILLLCHLILAGKGSDKNTNTH